MDSKSGTSLPWDLKNLMDQLILVDDENGGKDEVDKAGNTSDKVSVPILPPEILHLIFQQLIPVKDTLFNLCLTSRTFKDIALKYLYAGDIILKLHQCGAEKPNTLDCNSRPPATRYSRITSLFLSFFPDRLPVASPAMGMAHKTENLLLSLPIDQLNTFVLNGYGIDNYIHCFPGTAFLLQQMNIRRLCLPFAILQGYCKASTGVLPKMEALYLTDMRNLLHIEDLWALIHDTAQTLTSLAFICPLGSQLHQYFGHPEIFSSSHMFPETKSSLNRLRDLSISGVPNLGRFLHERARDLVDYKNLRSLRLEYCPRIESLLQTVCNVDEMPNLKSLQLIETCSPETFETIMPRMAPLETLYIIFPQEQNLPKYDMIKRYHSKTLKRVWLEHKKSSYVLDSTVRTIKFNSPPDIGYDGFFLTSWELLEEVALGIDLIRDNRPIILPHNLRLLRIVGTPRFDKTRYDPTEDAFKLAKNHAHHTTVRGKQPKLSVIAFFTLITPLPVFMSAEHPVIYLVEYIQGDGEPVPNLSFATIEDVRWLYPTLRMMEAERKDIPWADRDGALW